MSRGMRIAVFTALVVGVGAATSGAAALSAPQTRAPTKATRTGEPGAATRTGVTPRASRVGAIPGASRGDVTTIPPQTGVAIGRIAGASRYETAMLAAKARAQVPRMEPTRSVYLARGDRPIDALAPLGWHPTVLYLPPRGPIPRSLAAQFAALDVESVTVLGTVSALPRAYVRQLVGPRTRIGYAGDDPTIVSMQTAGPSGRWGSDDEWSRLDTLYVVPRRPFAVAAAAASDPQGRVLIGPAGPRLTARQAATSTYPRPEPTSMVRVAPVTEAVAREFSAALRTGRGAGELLGGRTPELSATRLAARAWPDGAGSVYLAAGDADADLAVAATFGDGPVLPVPRCGTPSQDTLKAVRALRPSRVVALGGVCDGVAQAVARVSVPRTPHVASALAQECVLTDGGVWCAADRWQSPRLRAFTVVAGLERDIAQISGECVLTVQGAVRCWGRILTAPAGDDWMPAPIQTVPGLERGVRALQASDEQVCAVLTDTTVRCSDLRGWRLDPTTRVVVIPAARPVAGLRDVTAVAVGTWDGARGGAHACALRGGDVTCWGQWEELDADGHESLVRHQPVPLTGVRPGVAELASSGWEIALRWPDGETAIAPLPGVGGDARQGPTADWLATRGLWAIRGAEVIGLGPYPSTRQAPGPVRDTSGACDLLLDGRVVCSAHDGYVLGFGG